MSKTSNPVLKKQRKASWGLQTMGSPLILKDVLRIAGIFLVIIVF